MLSIYDESISEQQSPSSTTDESPDETASHLSLDASVVPYIGQQFVTHDAAYEFYSQFAKRCGFSIRRHRTEGKDGVGKGLTRRYFVCHRAGNTPSKQPSELINDFRACHGINSTVSAVVLLVCLTIDWHDGHCYLTGSMSECLVSNQMNSTRGSELLANATVQLPETVVWPDEAVFCWSW